MHLLDNSLERMAVKKLVGFSERWEGHWTRVEGEVDVPGLAGEFWYCPRVARS